MCECGCTMNDTKYTLPAPDDGLYVISLFGACTNCVTPPGVTVELIEPQHAIYREYKRGEFTGPLKLEDWPDSKGAAILTGMTKGEFVKAVSKHLVGRSSDEVGVGDDGVIDQVGAECVVGEMYDDSQTRPRLA